MEAAHGCHLCHFEVLVLVDWRVFDLVVEHPHAGVGAQVDVRPAVLQAVIGDELLSYVLERDHCWLPMLVQFAPVVEGRRGYGIGKERQITTGQQAELDHLPGLLLHFGLDVSTSQLFAYEP